MDPVTPVPQEDLRRAAAVIALVLIYCAGIANFFIPTLRFGSQALNYLFFAAVQLLPIVIIRIGFRWQGWRRYLTALIGFVLLLPAAPVGLIATGCTAKVILNGVDWSFKRLNHLETDRGTVVAYLTDGGATTSFGIDLRQQCWLVPGVLVVRRLVHYRAREVELVQLSDGDIRATFPPYYVDDGPATSQLFELRHLPCLFNGGLSLTPI